MAPRKEKSEKSGSDLVLEYLRKQNRPYSATDVSSNLHNKVTKTNAAKYLKELHDGKRIECRAAGKQLVYHSIQSTPSSNSLDPNNQDPSVLDKQISELRTAINTLKSTEKQLKQELSTLSSIKTFQDLQAEHSALQTQKQSLTERITEHENTNANKDIKPVSPQEQENIEAEFKKWKKAAKLTNDAVKSFWTVVVDLHLARVDAHAGSNGSESLEEVLSVDELWESIGCEGPMPTR